MAVFTSLMHPPLRLVAAVSCAGALILSGCATHSAPGPQAESAPAAPTALSIDSPVERICAVPAGKAVLDRDLPGLTTHPDYAMFKSMSLKSIAAMSSGKITPAALKQVQTDLAQLPPPN